MRQLIPACFVLLLVGCRAPTGRPAVYRGAAPEVRLRGVVFVANGAGDTDTVSATLGRVVLESGAPLQVEPFDWSLGRGRYLADHLDHANHLTQGRRLAAVVTAYRRDCPACRVFLVGYSSGAAVTLAAADLLPPDSVERIILLAPALCVGYDLRPALRAACRGIDVFYSTEDRFILGAGMRVVGTADRNCREAAGRWGFTPVIACPADVQLYGKLRQHPWTPAVAWTGNRGLHGGSHQPEFLRAYVLPLLACD